MKDRMNAVKWTVLPATVTLLMACGGAPESTASAPDVLADTASLAQASVEIAGFTYDAVERVPWTTSVQVPARVVLDPVSHRTLGSITEGRVESVRVRVGDLVQAGDVLVTIHSHEIMDARRQLAASEAEVRAAAQDARVARAALTRAMRLQDARAIGQAELERAEVVATTAESRLATAEAEATRATALVEHLAGTGPLPAGTDLHEVLVRAPIAGAVVARHVVPGTVVLPGAPLVAVADPRAVQLEIPLTDQQLSGVVAGTRVQFTFTGDASGDVGEAVVRRVAPVVDAATRSTLVLAEITKRPAGTRAERFATATLEGAGEDSTMRVPIAAVQALAGDTVVIVAEPRDDGVFLRAVPVRVGRRSARFAELLVGPAVGSRVIVQGATVARSELLRRREGGDGE
jgi:cobalt-zinc-cadmium efflux system membrane fusion protein